MDSPTTVFTLPCLKWQIWQKSQENVAHFKLPFGRPGFANLLAPASFLVPKTSAHMELLNPTNICYVDVFENQLSNLDSPFPGASE